MKRTITINELWLALGALPQAEGRKTVQVINGKDGVVLGIAGLRLPGQPDEGDHSADAGLTVADVADTCIAPAAAGITSRTTNKEQQP